VYLTVAGQFTRRYLGLYSVAENVDTNFIEARFKTRLSAILKPSTMNPFTDRGTNPHFILGERFTINFELRS